MHPFDAFYAGPFREELIQMHLKLNKKSTLADYSTKIDLLRKVTVRSARVARRCRSASVIHAQQLEVCHLDRIEAVEDDELPQEEEQEQQIMLVPEAMVRHSSQQVMIGYVSGDS